MRKKANGKLCQIPREFFSHFLSPSSSLFALQPNRFFNIHLDTITIITGDSFSQLGHNISFSLPASLFISSLSLSLPAFLSLSAFVLLSLSVCLSLSLPYSIYLSLSLFLSSFTVSLCLYLYLSLTDLLKPNTRTHFLTLIFFVEEKCTFILSLLLNSLETMFFI